MAATTQMALVGAGVGQYRLEHALPVQRPGPGMLLCAVKAVALNPADWKMVDFSPTDGSIGGHEYAGEVLEVGAGVTKYKPGDRVLAVMFGLDPVNWASGAFCQFGLATADMACRIPDTMTYEEAAGLGISVSTTVLALYQFLGLPEPTVVGDRVIPVRPPKKPRYVLVAGGATATGTIAIQFLRASGVTPIATCSPENRDMLLALGAAETFDYHSSTCGVEIRNYTANTLALVLDCITQAETMKMCYEAIGSDGGRYVALDPFPTRIQYTRRDVVADWFVSYTMYGAPVKLAGVYGRPARPQDRVFGVRMFELIERMLAAGMIRPHPIEVRPGGLAAVASGIVDLRNGKVHARKLVYPIG